MKHVLVILKYLFLTLLWAVIGGCVLVVVLPQVPQVRAVMADKVSNVLAQALGTDVRIGSISLGLFNRVVIDDVAIDDRQGESLLTARRMAAGIELKSLARGRIVITNIQLFGARVNLYHTMVEEDTTVIGPLNAQFVIDALTSNDSTGTDKTDLRINTLLIRRSSLRYEDYNVKDISAHASLKSLTQDSINIDVKRLAFSLSRDTMRAVPNATEPPRYGSGDELKVEKLSLAFCGNSEGVFAITDFNLKLPRSEVTVSELHGDSTSIYPIRDTITLCPADLAFFVPQLKGFDRSITIAVAAEMYDRTLIIPSLDLACGGLHALGDGWLRKEDGALAWRGELQRLSVDSDFAGYVLDALEEGGVSVGSAQGIIRRLGDISAQGIVRSDPDEGLSVEAMLTTAAGAATVSLAKDGDGNMRGSIATDGMDIAMITDNAKFGDVALDAGFAYMNRAVPTLTSDISSLDYHGTSISLAASGNITLPLKGDIMNTFEADIGITGISMYGEGDTLAIDHVDIYAGMREGEHVASVRSDVGTVDLQGTVNASTLVPTVMAKIRKGDGDDSSGGRSRPQLSNEFTLQADLYSTEWIDKVARVPLTISMPVSIKAEVHEEADDVSLYCDMPRFSIGGNEFTNGSALAVDSGLAVSVSWEKTLQHGTANAVLSMADNDLIVDMLPSHVIIADTAWSVSPSRIRYGQAGITVDSFMVSNDSQYIIIEGKASSHAEDTLWVMLNDINVAYILDLVNFHSVEFSGAATGTAHIVSLMAKDTPLQAEAGLIVNDFRFEGGRMGTLHAGVVWNDEQKRIELDAVAQESLTEYTPIYGYISTSPSYIDLNIDAVNTNVEFLLSFTGSFMDNLVGRAVGGVNLYGPLNDVNLKGMLVVNGETDITPLGTHYTLMGDTVIAYPDEIELHNMPIFDRDGNMGIVSGYLHHKSLRRLTYDIDVEADNLLAYDFRDYGEENYYGTCYGTGKVDIHGRSGEILFNVNVTPNEGSQFVYNVASPDAIAARDFITWRSRSNEGQMAESGEYADEDDVAGNISSDMRINFLINCTPAATIRLLMDANTGDYITLNGNGTIRATYYNKGTFNMYGTYEVQSGTYDITIQELMRKDFTFNSGGTLMFSGNPFDAALNLQAVHTVNGVSLSDLSIGNSYSSNTVRVNCLMNIGGIARAPEVDFDIDIPQVSTDQKQMIRSVINSEEEMSRQVVYLLGIGRFYPKESNNASYASERQKSDVSLAAQSLLSGTISQQINSLLGSMIGNKNWTFGANIATGDDGWDNAEYEGLVSGKLLNSRLIIDGQFGYRDNSTNDNTSFIGDFDIKYLLLPNGNLAINVYNKTNDRYFVESSLNTQGIGLIMKKDFSNLKDLFGIKKK